MSNYYCQNIHLSEYNDELAEENERLKEEIKRIGEMQKCYKENLKLCKWQEQQINKLAAKLEKIIKIITTNNSMLIDKGEYKELILDEALGIKLQKILKIIEGAEDE